MELKVKQNLNLDHIESFAPLLKEIHVPSFVKTALRVLPSRDTLLYMNKGDRCVYPGDEGGAARLTGWSQNPIGEFKKTYLILDPETPIQCLERMTEKLTEFENELDGFFLDRVEEFCAKLHFTSDDSLDNYIELRNFLENIGQTPTTLYTAESVVFDNKIVPLMPRESDHMLLSAAKSICGTMWTSPLGFHFDHDNYNIRLTLSKMVSFHFNPRMFVSGSTKYLSRGVRT